MIVLAAALTLLQQDFDQGLIDRLRQTKPGDASRLGLIKKVSASGHPAAVRYMIEALQSPTAGEDLKKAAYQNLARVGGDAGADAILKARRKRSLLPPLEKRVTFEGWNETGPLWRNSVLFEQHTDASGRVWGLLNHNALGDRDDLWLAEFHGHRWINPVFTGLTAPPLSDRRLIWKNDLPTRIPALLASDIAKDSDNDGLSDLAEQRLSTNPNDSDTDGDGDRDELDPLPHIKDRPLVGEAEKIAAAAFEFRYHFASATQPAVIFPIKGLKPFEIVGWRGPVIWLTEDGQRLRWALTRRPEGIPQLSFARSPEGEETWEDESITWNEDRSEATIIVSFSYGLLDAGQSTFRLKKYKNDWVVIEEFNRLIS